MEITIEECMVFAKYAVLISVIWGTEEERKQGKSPNKSYVLPRQGYEVELLLAWASTQKAVHFLFQVFTVKSAGQQHSGQAAPFRLTETRHTFLNYISSLSSSGISQKPEQLTCLAWYDHHSVNEKSLLESLLKKLKSSAWTPASYLDFYVFTVVHHPRRTDNHDASWFRCLSFIFSDFFLPTVYIIITLKWQHIPEWWQHIADVYIAHICIDTYL